MRNSKGQPTDDSETAPKRRGRPPASDNQREWILDNAAELFGRVGFEKGSIRDLANELNLATSTIYHYFATKQDIYDEIYIRTLKNMVRYVGESVESEPNKKQRLLRFMTAHAQFFEDHYWDFSTITLGVAGVESTQHREQVIQWRDRYEGLIREIFLDSIRSGELREIDPVIGTRAVLSVLNWMGRWWKPGGPERAAAFAEKYYEILLNGMSAKHGDTPS